MKNKSTIKNKIASYSITSHLKVSRITKLLKQLLVNTKLHFFYLGHAYTTKFVIRCIINVGVIIFLQVLIFGYLSSHAVYAKINKVLSKQLQALDSLATGMCFLPSKIAEIVIPEENTFEKLQKTNPQLLQQMTADIRLSKPLLISLFPEMKDYPRYDPYKVQYEIMTILQKYQMLENYYTVRKLLLIEDLQLPQ